MHSLKSHDIGPAEQRRTPFCGTNLCRLFVAMVFSVVLDSMNVVLDSCS